MEILQVTAHLLKKSFFIVFGFQGVLLSNLTEVRGFGHATRMCKYLMLQFENSVVHLSVSAFYQQCSLFLCLAIALNSNSYMCFLHVTVLQLSKLVLTIFSKILKSKDSFPKSWCLPSFYVLGTGRGKGGLPTLDR